MKLAIYDFDGTYMKQQILKYLYKYWKEKNINKQAYHKTWSKIIVLSIFNKFHLFGFDKKRYHSTIMAYTADMFRSINRQNLDEFLVDVYHHLQPLVNQEIKQQMLRDKQNGFYTILLSGNFDIILKPYLNEGFDEVIGSVVDSDEGIISSKEVDIIIHSKKAEIILEKFPQADFKNSKAYADSFYDKPILELVGHPVAVFPDKQLLKIAKIKNYDIIYKD